MPVLPDSRHTILRTGGRLVGPALDIILDDCLREMRVRHASVAECLARYPAQASELGPLLQVAAALDRLPNTRPTQEFRQGTRRELFRLPDPPKPQRALTRLARGRGKWLIRVLALGLTLIGMAGTVGAVFASSSSIPGSSLYPLKRSTESLQLALTQDPEREALLRVGFADRRLAEAVALWGSNQPELADQAAAEYGAEVDAAFANWLTQSNEKMSPTALEAERVLIRQHSELERREARASGTSKHTFHRALVLSGKIIERLGLATPRSK